MNEVIDIYCERLEDGLLAEPLNALTNLSFFIAAYFAINLAKKNGQLIEPRAGLLIALLIMIGVGSTLFHTFATGWASLADTLPILCYQVAFLFLYARHIIPLSLPRTLALVGVFFITVIMFVQLPSDMLNGSLQYAPAIIFLAGLGIWHALKAKTERFILLVAAALFAVSLTFRSIDIQLCQSWPIGTHFLWHVLNGVVLYLTTRAYIVTKRRFS